MSGHPAPEVPALRIDLDDLRVPRGAHMLAQAATRAGWGVVLTYARGTTLTAQGAPGRIVDSLAVRLRLGGERAVAVWIDGKVSLAYTWLGHVPGYAMDVRKITVTELKGLLT